MRPKFQTALDPFRLPRLFMFVALALLPIAAASLHESYYVDLFTRIMIFGLAAVSLDLVLGYGGMSCFNQAAYLGVGSYAVGILSFYGIDNGFVHFAAAMTAAGLVALVIGAVSLRTVGIHFMMITLAFGQMLYYLGISVNAYGGDDGLPIPSQSSFPGLDLGNGVVLYYFTFACLFFCLWLSHRIVASRFGMVIQGIRNNERRMSALGFAVGRYKLAALVISGAMAGLAGALLANQTLFVSPAIMHWSRSGEIMMMVIIGGMQTLLGPVLGAAIMLLLEDVLSGWTDHWELIMGPLLVAIVMLTRKGLLGSFVARRRT